MAAALVTGNTVVLKCAHRHAVVGAAAGRLRARGRTAAGVFNYVNGSGSEAGEALVQHPDIAGITFTGSHQVGMSIARRMVAGPVPRPCIAEMGGKNAAIVTARRRPQARHRRHRALVLWHGRPEVLGAVAHLCRGARGRRSDRPPLVEATGDQGRRSHGARELARSGHQRSARRTVTGATATCCTPTAPASSSAAARPTDGRARRRIYLPADAGRGAAPASAVAAGNVPADRDARARADRDTAMALVNDSELGLTAGFFGGRGRGGLVLR